jgi:hypothetical protein
MRNLAFITLAVIVIGISACNKTVKIPPVSGNTFSATIDGKTEEFTSDSVRLNGTSGIYLSGKNPANNDQVMLYAGNSSGVFAPGTYYSDSTGVTPKGSQVFYRDGSISLGANGYGGYYYTYFNYKGIDYSGSVTFTTITDTLVKGTFTGSLIAENSVAGATGVDTRTVTDGKFTIYFKSKQQL